MSNILLQFFFSQTGPLLQTKKWINYALAKKPWRAT